MQRSTGLTLREVLDALAENNSNVGAGDIEAHRRRELRSREAPTLLSFRSHVPAGRVLAWRLLR